MIIEYIKREKNIDRNCQKAYKLIFGNFNDHMHLKLEAHE